MYVLGGVSRFKSEIIFCMSKMLTPLSGAGMTLSNDSN